MARRSYKGENNPNFKHGLAITGASAAKLYKKKYPERHRARNTVLSALKNGLLIKGKCAVCGDAKAEAHHEDYKKPLDVIWLCRKHHLEAHGGKWREY